MTRPPLRAAAIVLAAGQGRRLGRGPKAFVRLDDQTLLERAVARARRCGASSVIVILPPGPDPMPLPDDLVVLRNERGETGPLGSACLGVRALPEGVDAALLYPVDHHAVLDTDVVAVLAAVAQAPPGAARVVPRHGGRGGHPVLLLPPALTALASVADPAASTLRDVLAQAGPIHHVDGVSSGVRQNLNTPSDLPQDARSLATEAQ